MATDIRLHGFGQRATFRQALTYLDAQLSPLPSHTIPLSHAHQRILAQPIHAPHDFPPFNRALMDGYALQAAQTIGANPYNPLYLNIADSVDAHTACLISTGQPLPPTADAVLAAEYAQHRGKSLEIIQPIAKYENFSQQGSEFNKNALLLSAGQKLDTLALGLLASFGIQTVSVYTAPTVAVMVIGDELIPSKAGLPPRLADANTLTLATLIQRDGGVLTQSHLLPATRAVLDPLLSALSTDLLIITGSSGVGIEDIAPLSVAEYGELGLHGLALRPASTSGIGKIGNTLIFLISGNPAVAISAYELFIGRALRRLQGLKNDFPFPQQRVKTKRKLVSTVGWTDFYWGAIQDEYIEPYTHTLNSLKIAQQATGFVLIPEESEGYPAGSEIYAYRMK